MIGAMPFGGRALPAQLAAMAPSQVTAMLEDAQVLAQDVDRLKQRGLYADIEPDGARPAAIRGERGRHHNSAQPGAAGRLGGLPTARPGIPDELANPSAESVELAQALVSAFAEAGRSRTPKTAADVVLSAVRKVQKQTPSSRAENRPGRARHKT